MNLILDLPTSIRSLVWQHVARDWEGVWLSLEEDILGDEDGGLRFQLRSLGFTDPWATDVCACEDGHLIAALHVCCAFRIALLPLFGRHLHLYLRAHGTSWRTEQDLMNWALLPYAPYISAVSVAAFLWSTDVPVEPRLFPNLQVLQIFGADPVVGLGTYGPIRWDWQEWPLTFDRPINGP